MTKIQSFQWGNIAPVAVSHVETVTKALVQETCQSCGQTFFGLWSNPFSCVFHFLTIGSTSNSSSKFVKFLCDDTRLHLSLHILTLSIAGIGIVKLAVLRPAALRPAEDDSILSVGITKYHSIFSCETHSDVSI